MEPHRYVDLLLEPIQNHMDRALFEFVKRRGGHTQDETSFFTIGFLQGLLFASEYNDTTKTMTKQLFPQTWERQNIDMLAAEFFDNIPPEDVDDLSDEEIAARVNIDLPTNIHPLRPTIDAQQRVRWDIWNGGGFTDQLGDDDDDDQESAQPEADDTARQSDDTPETEG